MTKHVLFYLLLISLLYSSTPALASNTLSTNHPTPENSQNNQMYGYNENYTLTQWRSLSPSQRNEELQIPKHIFENLETKKLLVECLSHPFIAAFGAFTDPEKPSESFNHLRSKFMAFDHLVNRTDLTEAIVEFYTQSKTLPLNENSADIFISDLINVPEIIQQFSNDQITAISLRAIEIDQENQYNELYRIAVHYDTVFRIDKIYKRISEIYNTNIPIPEELTFYLQIIEELETIEKIEISRAKEEQKISTTRAYYPTRWGQSSMLIYPTTTYAPLSQSRVDYYNNHYNQAFPNAVRLSEPTNKFNCHSYSLFSYDGICEFYVIGSTAAAILNTNDNNYFNKTYYPSTSFPLNYTLVRWGDGTNTNHTGVLYSIYLSGTPGRPNFIGVKSKWGEAGIYYHDVYDCEYLGAISYYYRN